MKLKSINPADQSVVGTVEVATHQEIEEAVSRARGAFKTWRYTSVQDRASWVEKFTQEFLKHKDKLANLITLEMGKPISQSIKEVDWIYKYLEFYYQEGPKILQDKIIEEDEKVLRKVTREPIGVCGVITPWNFPVGMPIWGIMPNLIAGNTVVFKPTENAPLCGQEIIDIFDKVGLPDGLLNIVHGNGEVGAALADSDVDMIWFTGSSKVGEELYGKCGEKFIHCMLELGGSSPAIILEDANINNAIENIYNGRFLNCGQVCSAIKRLFVHESVYKEVLAGLIERVKNTKVGNPLEEVDFGPLASKKQLELLVSQVEDAMVKGANVAVGGARVADENLRNGFYYPPTILTNVNFRMRVLTEEVFGPVLPVMSFDDIDEAIKMANKTEYGLTAQVYTQNLELGNRIARRIEAGVVSINSNSYSTPATPFGGYKKSGKGREGGKYGFYELTQIKYICETKI